MLENLALGGGEDDETVVVTIVVTVFVDVIVIVDVLPVIVTVRLPSAEKIVS